MDKIKGLTRDEWGVTLQGMARNALSTVLRSSSGQFCENAKNDAMQSAMIEVWRRCVVGDVKFLSKRIMYLMMCKKIRGVLFQKQRGAEADCERVYYDVHHDDAREKLIAELLAIPRFAPVVSAYLMGMTKREMRTTFSRRKLDSILDGIRDYVSLKHADFEL